MVPPYLFSVHKWPFSAISASIGGIACATYTSTPTRNAADFLELAENCSFLDRKLISALNETMDGLYLFPSSTKLAPADWVNRPLISLIVIRIVEF